MPAGSVDSVEAIKRFQYLAWQGKWHDAIGEISVLIENESQSVEAHFFLGMAYENIGRLQDALAQYDVVKQLAPDRVLVLNKIARLRERVGNIADSKKELWAIIRLQESRGNISGVEATLKNLIEIDSNDTEALAALAETYLGQGKGKKASQVFVELAKVAAKTLEIEKALLYSGRASECDEENIEAKSLVRGLQNWKSQAEAGVSAETMLSRIERFIEAPLEGIPTTSPVTPFTTGSTMTEGYAIGVGELLEGQDTEISQVSRRWAVNEIDERIQTALSLEVDNKFEDAIVLYQKMIQSGVDDSLVILSLGRVYWRAGQFRDALRMLNMVVDKEETKAVSNVLVGLCHDHLGQTEKAIEHLYAGITAWVENSEEKIDLHLFTRGLASLVDLFGASGRVTESASLLNRSIRFLRERGDQAEAEGLENQLTRVTVVAAKTESLGDDMPPGLEAILGEAVTRSRTYLESHLFVAAIDECLMGIGYSPGYLPIHVRLAEIYSAMGMISDAVSKYETVADVYLVRGAVQGAIEMYEKVLELTPGDSMISSKLSYLRSEQGKLAHSN